MFPIASSIGFGLDGICIRDAFSFRVSEAAPGCTLGQEEELFDRLGEDANEARIRCSNSTRELSLT
jgi:hypothetical protein